MTPRNSARPAFERLFGKKRPCATRSWPHQPRTLGAGNPSDVLVFGGSFRRSAGSDELLVVASLNNRVFDAYAIQTDAGRLPDGQWRELFNSDAPIYGGDNVGNFGADLPAGGGRLQLRLPANAVLILQTT